MIGVKLFLIAALGALGSKAANVSVAIGGADPTIGLSPFGSWFEGMPLCCMDEVYSMALMSLLEPSWRPR